MFNLFLLVGREIDKLRSQFIVTKHVLSPSVRNCAYAACIRTLVIHRVQHYSSCFHVNFNDYFKQELPNYTFVFLFFFLQRNTVYHFCSLLAYYGNNTEGSDGGCEVKKIDDNTIAVCDCAVRLSITKYTKVLFIRDDLFHWEFLRVLFTRL